ncbi:MAG: SIS domain-containing protein [Gemmatimonadaceae bacterium]|jgi:D-sedoheptulose 7-phosphate isomerase|nr:SIS domain-containing protein [Gemmatimonadaceae bacterium]
MSLPLTDALRALADTATRTADALAPAIDQAYAMVRAAVDRRGTLLFCGNGGSAADAQHLATEYVVRFMRARAAYSAIALTTDSSALTAIGNDFGFDQLFARQVEAIGRPGDLLMLHSTSGNSPNLVAAVHAARARSIPTLGFLAKGGGALASLVDHAVIVPTDRTDRAQELHLCIQHAICDRIDAHLTHSSS